MEVVKHWYGRRMHTWEHDLATRSTDRVVRPFEWGTEWMQNWPVQSSLSDPESRIAEVNRLAISRAADFYKYEPPRDFRLEGSDIRFTSAVASSIRRRAPQPIGCPPSLATTKAVRGASVSSGENGLGGVP